jgi:DNA-directed RNA polymerase III subunit RPC6
MMHAQLIELLEAAGTAGVKQTDLQRGLKEATGAPVDLTTMAEALNRMLKEGMISIGKLADGTPVYRRQSSQDATRLTGLSSEERLVLQLIETTGNIGMWTRDIRLRSNLQQARGDRASPRLIARAVGAAVHLPRARSC